jgi:DNA-binding NarL/FixJ family response regulator
VRIIELVAEGFCNEAVGLKLGISMQRVKNHLRNVYRKVRGRRGFRSPDMNNRVLLARIWLAGEFQERAA